MTPAECAVLAAKTQGQCVAAAATAANTAQPKFDALAAAFGGLSVSVAIGAVVIGVLAIVITVVVTIVGYQWGKVVVREAKADARDEARRLISDFLRTEAPRIIREGAAGLQTPNGGLNQPPDISDTIAEASG
ncbi:MAG: hypothetical protein AB1429_14295 [Pseudomonadota bacterium]|jgi:hypothetical protein